MKRSELKARCRYLVHGRPHRLMLKPTSGARLRFRDPDGRDLLLRDARAVHRYPGTAIDAAWLNLPERVVEGPNPEGVVLLDDESWAEANRWNADPGRVKFAIGVTVPGHPGDDLPVWGPAENAEWHPGIVVRDVGSDILCRVYCPRWVSASPRFVGLPVVPGLVDLGVPVSLIRQLVSYEVSPYAKQGESLALSPSQLAGVIRWALADPEAAERVVNEDDFDRFAAAFSVG